jgi:hypothetical protein
LEEEAVSLLHGFLALVTHERQRTMVRAQVLRFLEDPSVRRRLTGDDDAARDTTGHVVRIVTGCPVR